MEAYRIENVSFSYPEMNRKALHAVSFAIRRGDFVTICGRSGSGKSTLLRHLKTVHTPFGQREGDIYFFRERLDQIDHRRQASEIGFVFQSPDNQLVTDKVWHELAFGLESLGLDQSTIRLRVAEMASFFGIQSWFYKKTSELSGGQKQILNLASIMAMQPSVLILDEPTSQLDPIAANEFLDMLRKINRELGMTIVMTEHRLEEVVPISDCLVVMDNGRMIASGPPRAVGEKLHQLGHPMFAAMPAAMQIGTGAESTSALPVTISEARDWLDRQVAGKEGRRVPAVTQNVPPNGNIIVKLEDVWFRYEKRSVDIIKDLSLEVREGEFYCIVGGNGTGKTTALSLISGIHVPYRGKIFVNGKDIARATKKARSSDTIAALPQNPKHMFVEKTLELELNEMLSDRKLSEEEKKEKIDEAVRLTELEHMLSMHPYDLSGGEQQRAALAKILLLEPKIMLLDEPTKGLDAFFKARFADIVKRLQKKGVTLIMVSHDIEFCARYADVCALFFDGSIVTVNPTRTFFSGNSFYTTSANRIARHICPDAVTVEDVVALCRRNA
ncbi:ABC transporter ATP-binding protein [Xylanibacillus composti]|uniref:ABC transporter domain-containing protein n=1 Tax=Xylanibacillus composti TaxID=1572762 RepID=A0A8J4M3Y6_9BACL|nr:energy-coupling factor transporter ATPase [Xylanibacillus composti]MDT9726312.1 ABC transporter ATP-binding protein [Xylanibacillus composti]GIQ70582.1 hypothetical protein XYCOK13_34060 [Xylanibacillus composti]